MTRGEFDLLEIPSQCRQPDPLACYERLTSNEPPEAETCLHCPVASWIVAMVFSGNGTNETATSEEMALAA